jgi:hypothetical protein
MEIYFHKAQHRPCKTHPINNNIQYKTHDETHQDKGTDATRLVPNRVLKIYDYSIDITSG